MKKLTAILVVMLLVFSAVFAAGSTESAAKEKVLKDRLVIVHSRILEMLDPYTNSTSINKYSYRMTHNTLLAHTESGEVGPCLAKEYSVSDNGLVYTFKLRDDVNFNNGEHFTAADVKFSLERAKDMPAMKAKAGEIKEVQIIDDYTVKVVLKSINVEMLDNFTDSNMSILCKKAVENGTDDERFKVGTGPYIMKEWVPDDYTLYEVNPNYWGEKPYMKEVKFQKMAEASARVIALQTGEADLCLDVPGIEAGHLEDTGNTKLIRIPSLTLVYVGLNEGGYNKALTDVRVRRAINHATNQKQLIALMREGYASETAGIIPPDEWGYYDGVKGYEYDVEKAKALLKEAGYSDLKLSLTYDSAAYPGLFEILQSMWAKAGITLTLDSGDATITTTKVKKTYDFDVTVAKWSYSTIGRSLQSLWLSGSSSNKTLTKDPKLDAMLKAAGSELDDAKRKAAYAEISQYITDNAGMVPMYINQVLLGANKTLEGLVAPGSEEYNWNYVKAYK